jgi:uncharacterized damage-inducible protein DinB
MRDYFATLARYNVWATVRLLEQVDALDDDAYRRDVGLFFRSIHGTLNHLLVGEHLVWFPRFADGASPVVVLDAEVEPDRARLRERLYAGARNWLPFVGGLDDARLAGVLSYTTMRGAPATLPFAATLGHVFNHGTHHRGQITAALTALGRPGPELDMIYMLQQEAATP